MVQGLVLERYGSADNLLVVFFQSVPFMEFPPALVCPEVQRDPIDEGFNRCVRQHHQVRNPGLRVRG